MDASVLRAMSKWPNVPDVYHRLSLDRRGNWRIDGEEVKNPKSIAFINQNYERGPDGNWFFQNGPQRVWLDLEYTPWVLRYDGKFKTQMDQVFTADGVLMDEEGNLLLISEKGLGLIHDQDLLNVLEQLVDHEGTPFSDEELTTLVEAALALEPGQDTDLFLKLDEHYRVKRTHSSQIKK